MKMQNRWKSPVIYIALVSQVLSILLASGAIAPELVTAIRVAITAALEILVLIGIFNNPQNKESF